MRAGKRGETETLSFLVGLIIFLLIALPVGIAVYHYIYAGSNMERTLKLLVAATSELKDGKRGMMTGYIDEGYILLGFEKDRDHFGGNGRWSCNGWWFPWDIDKPAKCSGKACLCICDITEVPVIGWDIAVTPGACDDAACITYDKELDPRFYGGGVCEYGPFIKPSQPILNIWYEKKGQEVGICDSPFTEDGKQVCIAKEVTQAVQAFKEFYNAYKECKNYESKDCMCSKVFIDGLPEDISINLRVKDDGTQFRLIDRSGPTRSVAFIDKDIPAEYVPSKDDIIPLSEKSLTNPPTGSSDLKRSVGLFRSKEGYVSIVMEGLDSVHGKEYCSDMDKEALKEAKNTYCTFDARQPYSGVCIEGGCKSEFTAERAALEGQGCSKEGYSCCEMLDMCGVVNGKCKAECESEEKELVHEVYGKFACEQVDEKCCGAKDALLVGRGSSECEINYGICKDNGCDLMSEYRDSRFGCGNEKMCCILDPKEGGYLPPLPDVPAVEHNFDYCIDGDCQPGCDPSTQTELAGKRCPNEGERCCKQGSACQNLAGGECKGTCQDELNEEEASDSLFTSLPCDPAEKCCVKKPADVVPL